MDIVYLRSFKVGPFAIFDLVVSYVGIYLIAPLLSWVLSLVGLKADRAAWLWLTLPLAILFHLIFNQNTPLSKMVLSPNSGWLAKVVLVVMLVVGISQIRIGR
jgi:hypothetical protein